MNCAVLSPCHRFLHFLDWSGLADLIDQEGGDVSLCSWQIAEELQQADDFGGSQRPTFVIRVVIEALADFVDIGASLVGQVALDQLKRLVERDWCADGLLGESGPFGHQHLVGLFDDRPVAAAVVPRCTRLEPDARHDADAEFNVVRWVGVELDKIGLVDIGAVSRAFES